MVTFRISLAWQAYSKILQRHNLNLLNYTKISAGVSHFFTEIFSPLQKLTTVFTFTYVIIPWIPWNLSFRYIHCTGQFTPKMKANAVPRLLSSLVWIDQYNECNGMTSFMEFMKRWPMWPLLAGSCDSVQLIPSTKI